MRAPLRHAEAAGGAGCAHGVRRRRDSPWRQCGGTMPGFAVVAGRGCRGGLTPQTDLQIFTGREVRNVRPREICTQIVPGSEGDRLSLGLFDRWLRHGGAAAAARRLAAGSLHARKGGSGFSCATENSFAQEVGVVCTSVFRLRALPRNKEKNGASHRRGRVLLVRPRGQGRARGGGASCLRCNRD